MNVLLHASEISLSHCPLWFKQLSKIPSFLLSEWLKHMSKSPSLLLCALMWLIYLDGSPSPSIWDLLVGFSASYHCSASHPIEFPTETSFVLSMYNRRHDCYHYSLHIYVNVTTSSHVCMWLSLSWPTYTSIHLQKPMFFLNTIVSHKSILQFLSVGL